MSFPFGFDLKALEVFVEVIKSGNMTLAAQRLNVTQSSISQCLSNLEKSLETQLIDRSVRPMQVTANGRYFYDRSIKILTEARQTSQNLKSGRVEQLQNVRVALVDSLAVPLGNPLMGILSEQADDWAILSGLSHSHAKSLLTNEVDIIISDDAVLGSDELVRFPILREPMVLIVPAGYNYQQGQLDNLSKTLTLARYPVHTIIGKTVEEQLKKLQLESDKRLFLDNTYAIANMVATGNSWAVTTPLCLYQCSDEVRSKLAVHPLPNSDYRELTVVSRRSDLWHLPEEIAGYSRGIIREKALVNLETWLPWLKGMYQ
ncbi:LysR family transcriptional regulator [Endozoicomonas sp. OPT23]|uniref:LysR family transcriptional regulator n=1 Tax=Endozoicomonas sp. OPT23 TaxID=2072845 RepID=UPI00129AC743|nr:LysR family transcriptional regulator [Endozoicomonas sp. OPT23]MRI31760.1 LysR family transcriptional regulator [Endozoicomonas sp. OPT23]